MSKNQNLNNVVSNLLAEVRVITHSSLMFQTAIAIKMDLNTTEAVCIEYLVEKGASTAGDLAKVTGLTTGAMTNVIDRLERAGLVKREKHPNDRRKVMVIFLPEKHKRIVKTHDSIMTELSELFSSYSKKEIKLLIAFTSALNGIYRKHTEFMSKKTE